jgi:Asp-tRNA(Asn)/Glu-tRNA(Gln) amidotransferase A subunit family amidase
VKDLTTLSAVEAARGIREGSFTSQSLVTACLKRLAEREGDVGAWAHIDPHFSLARARAADAKIASGASVGPLAGVPVGVKDIIDTVDFPTENGTPIHAGRKPAHDAAIVAKLKAAGAIILGKTVTTELAFFGPGKTRNPHNGAHTPGGSSSGSAAAVADRHVPIALGTQTAGSIIRPASYCGVIGFKPTFGAVSRVGVLEQSSPLDTIGGYARSIEDIALLLDVISGFDERDSAMRKGQQRSLLVALSEEPERAPRLAFVKSPAWPQGDSEMKEAFTDFVEGLGDVVTEVELPGEFDGSLKLQQTVQFSDIARNFGLLLDRHPNQISAKLKEVIAEGRNFSAAAYDEAIAARDPLYDALAGLLEPFDAIITPASCGVAPHGLDGTGSPAFNALWTYLLMPAISLPLLTLNGMPLGVQLVGRRSEDGALLRTARWLLANSQPK